MLVTSGPTTGRSIRCAYIAILLRSSRANAIRRSSCFGRRRGHADLRPGERCAILSCVNIVSRIRPRYALRGGSSAAAPISRLFAPRRGLAHVDETAAKRSRSGNLGPRFRSVGNPDILSYGCASSNKPPRLWLASPPETEHVVEHAKQSLFSKAWTDSLPTTCAGNRRHGAPPLATATHPPRHQGNVEHWPPRRRIEVRQCSIQRICGSRWLNEMKSREYQKSSATARRRLPYAPNRYQSGRRRRLDLMAAVPADARS